MLPTLYLDSFKQYDYDSQIRLLNWKLKKNLETLIFLSELESRYQEENTLPSVIQEYYDLKKDVQSKTVELSNELAYYKSLQTKCA
ncbi:hypothetical protein [uncultured Psychroserpens sp.]|uniref:hypothetical protein n=1 Tax=uncultured Psychroserpens sp. TaxID=255436 RepID=UPI00260C885C|nr:hypothetical protein [uncultured Psychroserpens sp.]